MIPIMACHEKCFLMRGRIIDLKIFFRNISCLLTKYHRKYRKKKLILYLVIIDILENIKLIN